jgi:hypothetical protein
MGRVSRYRRVKKFDPCVSANGSGRNLDLDSVGVWGLGGDGRKAKKVSRTVLKIRAQREKRMMKKKGAGKKPSLERFQQQQSRRDVLDSAYDGEDDFDLSDPVGSLRRVVPPASSSSKTPPSRDPFPSESSSKKAKSDTPSLREGHDAADVSGRNLGVGHADPEKNDEEEKNRDAEAEEQRLVRRLGLDAAPPAAGSAPGGRMPGEGKNAFRRRAALEARQIIRRTRLEQCNPEKRRRRKEFLDNKKKRKKGGGAGASNAGGENDGDDDGDRRPAFDDDDGSSIDRPTRVVFGEQVEAPPVFRQRPRGAATAAPSTTAPAASNNKKKGMTGDEIAAEREAMEAIRRKAQAHYSLVKARRRQEGSFHL